MTWRQVGAIYLALAMLAGYFVVVEQRGASIEPAPDAPTAARSLLGADASAVTAVRFRRDGEQVSATRDGDRWRVVEPAGAAVPPDLIAAAVATLTGGQVSEVMAEGPRVDLAVFGLEMPSSEMEIEMEDVSDAPVRVLLGAHNPTGTALYAKRDDMPTVFLVGLNLRYYEDLIFEAAAETPG